MTRIREWFARNGMKAVVLISTLLVCAAVVYLLFEIVEQVFPRWGSLIVNMIGVCLLGWSILRLNRENARLRSKEAAPPPVFDPPAGLIAEIVEQEFNKVQDALSVRPEDMPDESRRVQLLGLMCVLKLLAETRKAVRDLRTLVPNMLMNKKTQFARLAESIDTVLGKFPAVNLPPELVQVVYYPQGPAAVLPGLAEWLRTERQRIEAADRELQARAAGLDKEVEARAQELAKAMDQKNWDSYKKLTQKQEEMTKAAELHEISRNDSLRLQSAAALRSSELDALTAEVERRENAVFTREQKATRAEDAVTVQRKTVNELVDRLDALVVTVFEKWADVDEQTKCRLESAVVKVISLS